MWRQVLSQSPATAPADAATQRQTDKYLRGWHALGALMHSGRSLSGHERNCCFLNTGQMRFADVSATTGLDHDADSRGQAVVDWDGDGDLDLWVTNRTRPRVRYLQNETQDTRGSDYLAIKLRGVTCNRDAVGARVSIKLNDIPLPITKSVMAGEGFLSQSSKCLHFGLGRAPKIERVQVRWPGGATESFSGIEPNGRYVITQGRPGVEVWQKTRRSPALARQTLEPPRLAETRRIVLPRRLPLPRIEYRTFAGRFEPAFEPGSPTLVNLWATWCKPCIAELSSWDSATAEFEKVGLRVVLLNVDFAQQQIGRRETNEVRDRYEQLGLTFDVGLVDRKNAELIEIIKQMLFLRQRALPIPSSMLVDRHAQLAIFYEGPLTVDQLLRDVRSLDVEFEDPRDPAVPFSGRWLTAPFPPDLLQIPNRLVEYQRLEEAYDYLKANVLARKSISPADVWQEFGVRPNKIVDLLTETGRLALASGQTDRAIELFQHATEYAPENWNAQVRLAQVLIAGKRSAEAIQVSQRMAKLQPRHPLPRNNIAWVLATSDDDSIRDVKRAIRIAEELCQRTKYQEPSALDTLAVAYAADGRFNDAVRVAQQAIVLCRKLKLDALTKTIAARLELYKQGRAFQP